jgi:hypothetical protein
MNYQEFINKIEAIEKEAETAKFPELVVILCTLLGTLHCAKVGDVSYLRQMVDTCGNLSKEIKEKIEDFIASTNEHTTIIN